MKLWLGKSARARRAMGALAAILSLVFSLALSCHPAAAQKNKKTKTNSNTPQLKDDAAAPPIPATDPDQLDRTISEMLAAFQLGNVEEMHKYYADSVTFVSGDFSPPVVGWQNYVPLYQRQISAFQGVQMIRKNTIIFPHGDVAWAMYQWEFLAGYEGKPYTLRGQTTLIFNRIDGHWLIVHNHTSAVESSAQTQPPPAAAKP